MSSAAVCVKGVVKDESEDDKELQSELKLLVDKITGSDAKLIPPALEMLKYLIRTSTTSMTSVPKPLKYLVPYYDLLKSTHAKMSKGPVKKSLADVISVLAMGTAGGEAAKIEFDCLNYCLAGTMENIGDWGHEYIRQLENEIVQQWSNCDNAQTMLMPLVRDIIKFNCSHHAEIQACDLLMEIDQLPMLLEYIAPNTYQRMCMYLTSCTKYVDEIERTKIMKITCQQYLKFGEHARSLINSILLNDKEMVQKIFTTCKDKATLRQLAFICARHLYYPFSGDDVEEEEEEITNILTNNHLSSYFLSLARELDIMEPKSPEDVYKTWLEPVPARLSLLGENVDSARQNLASSFVNGFVNAGFGTDTLLTTEGGNKWIYRNKEHGMMSAAAALGVIHLWDVDGGLTPIDKYLYTSEDYIKAGALLALGIVNCRVRNECDPALALLGDYVESPVQSLQVGAVLGVGLAYAGTKREDVLALLLPLVTSSKQLEVLAVSSIACGLISLGVNTNDVSSSILNKMMESVNTDQLKSPYMRLAGLGACLCYFGARDGIDAPTTAMEVFEEPFRTTMQCMLQMCAYSGTGDVLIIQELLRLIADKIEPAEPPEKKVKEKTKKDSSNNNSDGAANSPKPKKSVPWDMSQGQAMATLAVAAVAMGEEIGMEMIQRNFGHIGRYGEPSIRKAVPLAVALTSVSNPQLMVIDVLTKYSHDSDDEVACNAIFGLGFIGAGSNNARLAASLRQLAAYHNKNPSQLFMVRIAQGFVHMGKGTMTFNPLHTDRQLVDPIAMAGLLVTLVAMMEPHSLILGRSHYLLYTLAAAIQPRWLVTLDENLEPLPVTVRVGQAVDIVAKAGTPKTIAGIHTHTTPVLLTAGERAELATDEYELFSPTLDGICVLKKKPVNV